MSSDMRPQEGAPSRAPNVWAGGVNLNEIHAHLSKPSRIHYDPTANVLTT
jgi:hypothetical protein